MALVYTIVYGKLSNVCNKQDIEETVSDIFYQIYRARNLIDLEKGSLKSYIAVVSKRAAIDIYRKQRGKNDIVSINEFEYDWIASCTDIEKDVIDSETSDLLIKEIKALGEPDSQIMIRKYYFGQTSKAIAKVLGIKENTINKKVSRALVKLQQALGGVL
jgi:RNA polymerase sigma-70 factor (ECF subfamily)